MEGSVPACSQFLKSKSIKAQKDWLEACIEWLIEENNGIPNINELKEQVYEQWLLSDLREIAEPSFPLVSVKGSKTINGKFAVQINSLYDIGHSAYSQLQKLKGQEIDDCDEDDNEDNSTKEFFKRGTSASNRTWKELSSRMLFIELHDGSQLVNGVEYQPIKDITMENVMPGAKVLLTGPITCRDGMLLLKPENLSLLGGNSEVLLKTNTYMKLLKNILRIEDDEDIQQASSNVQQQQQRQQQTTQIQITSRQETHSATSHSKPKIPSNTAKQTKLHLNKSPQLVAQAVKNQSKHSATASAKSVSHVSHLEEDFFQNDIFGEIDMDDWDLSPAMKTSSTSRLKDTQTVNVHSDTHHPVSILLSKSTSTGRNRSKLVTPYRENRTAKKMSTISLNNNLMESSILDFDIDNDLFSDDIDLIRDEKTNSNTEIIRSGKYTLGRDKDVDESKYISGRDKEASKSSNLNNERYKEYKDNVVYANIEDSIDTKADVRDNCLFPEPNLDDFFDGDDDNELHGYVFEVAPQVVPACSGPDIYVKAVKMSEMVGSEKPIKDMFSVKGWFKTLSSQLEFKDKFKLLAIMTDGRYFAEVLIGDEALSPLIGFTAYQVQEASTNKLPKQKRYEIKGALSNAERALEMNKWIMHFCYDESENIYKVVKMKEIENTT